MVRIGNALPTHPILEVKISTSLAEEDLSPGAPHNVKSPAPERRHRTDDASEASDEDERIPLHLLGLISALVSASLLKCCVTIIIVMWC